jgi:hypothetical protein
MKRLLAAFLLVAASALPAAAQTYSDIDVDLPSVPGDAAGPELARLLGARLSTRTTFFYDGLFWDFHHDLWHWSAWYNGPWAVADPVYVPTYVLWVPIYYYRKPPHYFHSWKPDRPPRWAEHWGRDWQARHNQVFQGPRGQVARAPLPTLPEPLHARELSPERRNSRWESTTRTTPTSRSSPVVRQHYQARGLIVTPNPTLRGHSPPPPDGRRDDPPPRERR